MDDDEQRVKPHISSFSSFVNHTHRRIFEGPMARHIIQPHFSYLNKMTIPYGNRQHPADAVCAHYLKKGLIRGDRMMGSSALLKMTAACWSGDGGRLFCGLENGYYGLWDNEVFKFYKPIGVHIQISDGEVVGIPIRAMSWSKHGDFVASTAV